MKNTRPKVGDIMIGDYIINKVRITDKITLCAGDTEREVKSLMGEPSRVYRNTEDTLDCHEYDSLNVTILYESLSILDSIHIRNPNISYMGYSIGDLINLNAPDLNIIHTKDGSTLIEWEQVIEPNAACKFIDLRPTIYLYWKMKPIQKDLAQIEEIIIQFPRYIEGKISRAKVNEAYNTLSNWCKVIMKDY